MQGRALAAEGDGARWEATARGCRTRERYGTGPRGDKEVDTPDQAVVLDSVGSQPSPVTGARMFKKFAAEALGLSDIGVIIAPKDFDKVDADDYLFHEDQEKIFFLIKSKKDEYCFTNLALVHVDGESAISAKRAIRRYDYASYTIGNVTMETAGTIDLDVELKFTIGEKVFSIDVRKDFIESLKDIYKALYSIGKLQRKDEVARGHAATAASVLGSMFKLNTPNDPDAVAVHYRTILAEMNAAVLERHLRRDFSAVFEKYIHG